ncbi:MAG: BTAD domain-containing putative transcriptional regulator [Candidatus Bipolaricaulia bacterium]
MPELGIYLFGYPRVECDGVPVPIRRRKALALLSYLAATGSSHSRDVLAALLWPEHESSRAFAFLRNALWILNQTPLTDWLVSTRHTIGLREDQALKVDVAAFRQAITGSHNPDDPDSADRLARASLLFAHDFLEGFSVEDSEPFEDWQFSESGALRQELAEVLERLSLLHENRGSLDQAIRFAHRRLEVQPMNESVHRRLMDLYTRSGQRASALAQFDACREILKTDLGIEPSEETVSLAERIRKGAAPSSVARRPAVETSVSLPRYRTALVGRETELAKAVSLLQSAECRLLTVTGPGGCGKTRLAVEVAQESAPNFPDGVVFVPLVSTSTSSHVPLEIANALGPYCARDRMDEEHSRRPGTFSDRLLEALESQRMLLVLDNMEHLLVDLRWIETLLERATGITLLVTSRHEMKLRDEWILAVEGLPFPRGHVAQPDLAGFDAVSLFLQAARRANASFTPEGLDWEAISDIVRLVEGMPLGIELAAAWIRTMSCSTIASEVAGGLDFLSTQLRDVPKRHHSLRAVFAQSWNLLSRDARSAFRRLSVFPGGFSRDAARTVTGATLPILSSLVARSLLRRASTDRYEMLEVLRQYAEERLRAMPGEATDMRDAHCSFHLDLLAESEDALKRSGQRRASELLREEIDNIRAAWSWAIARGRFDAIERAAMGLFLYCDMRNQFVEGANLFGEAAEGFPAGGSRGESVLYGFLRGLGAWFARMQRGVPSAEVLFDESLGILESSGMSRELAFIRLLWSFSGFGSRAQRRKRLAESLEFFEGTQSLWEAAEVHEALAWAVLEDDASDAIEHALQSVSIHERLEDPWGIAMAKFTLGTLYAMAKDYERGRKELEESLALRRENDLDPLGAMQCIIELGNVASQIGDWSQASSRYLEALGVAEERGARWAQATIHESLARVSAEVNDPAHATHHVKVAIGLYRDFGRKADVDRCGSLLESIAEVRRAG